MGTFAIRNASEHDMPRLIRHPGTVINSDGTQALWRGPAKAVSVFTEVGAFILSGIGGPGSGRGNLPSIGGGISTRLEWGETGATFLGSDMLGPDAPVGCKIRSRPCA